MDIWQWIYNIDDTLREQGHDRLADLIDELPTHTCDNEHDRVDAIVPEALNLARQYNSKWLEVFIRHWHLQSRVLLRCEVKDQLPEAIDLLDFAHQEDTRDCPQSVCVVQDLANCYANMDGPGYVEERLAVATETLDRIDPSWPCFECIGVEYQAALLDSGRYDELLAHVAKQRQAILKATGQRNRWAFCFTEIQALIELGRLDEAAQIGRNAVRPTFGDAFINLRRGYLGVVLALQGNYDEAQSEMLSFERALHTASYCLTWARTAFLLASNGAIENDWRLNAQLSAMAEKLHANGVIRNALDISVWQAQLAFQRQQQQAMSDCCQRIELLCTQLNKDLGATAQLVDLQQMLSELPPVGKLDADRVETSEELLARLPEDPEQRLSILIAGAERWPANESVVLCQADTLEVLLRGDEVDAILADFIKRQTNAPTALLRWGHRLLETATPEIFEQEFESMLRDETLDQEARANALWIVALFRRAHGDEPSSRDALGKLIELQPMARNALQFLAQVETNLGEYDAAITRWNALLEHYPDELYFHWDRMIPATLSDQWALVRESARVLELDLEQSDKPVEEEWGRIRVQFIEADGDTQWCFAHRTGPVTARVDEISSPQLTQRYKDWVVFDATPLNKLDQEDDEGNAQDSEGFYTYLYRTVGIKASGDYQSFAIDGVYPGDEHWQALLELLKTFGVDSETRSTDEYELCHPDSEATLQGIYSFLAIPKSAGLQAVADLLAHQTASYEHPLIWPGLLEALGDTQMLERQSALEKSYGM